MIALFHSPLASFHSPIGDESANVLASNGKTAMRDIRNDLRERLASVLARYSDEITDYSRKCEALEAGHKKTLTALAAERTALEQLLAVEDERRGISMPTLAQKIATLVPLKDFLVTKVQAHGPMEKDQLRAEAKLAGYLADGSGRTFHITLMNVTKRGPLMQLPDGRYAALNRERAMFDQSQEGEMQALM